MISMNLFVLCRVAMFGETFVIQRPSIVISCPYWICVFGIVRLISKQAKSGVI
jgi:hypothetical protein